MTTDSRIGRYSRIYEQLESLLKKCNNPIARMATVCAVLKNKQPHFFWCGFYLLSDGELVVAPYQGSVACMVLRHNTGVCWEAVNSRKSVVVDDVNQFPGHIACDSRSKSEIVVPVFHNDTIMGVLDVDSDKLSSFDDLDREWLEKIATLIYV